MCPSVLYSSHNERILSVYGQLKVTLIFIFITSIVLKYQVYHFFKKASYHLLCSGFCFFLFDPPMMRLPPTGPVFSGHMLLSMRTTIPIALNIYVHRCVVHLAGEW